MGLAAIWQQQWFQIKWSDFPEFQSTTIAVKELLPIFVAAATWGPHCDIAAVVATIKGGIAKICTWPSY